MNDDAASRAEIYAMAQIRPLTKDAVIRKAIAAAGSITALSEGIGISRESITKWAMGQTRPRIANMCVLHEYLRQIEEDK